jgi:carboxymethylenebutenolidase
MSGGLTIALARAYPERIAAAASIHGGWLVTDDDDSPHRGLDKVRAEVYLGWCDNDVTAPADTVPVMRQALDDAGVRFTLDFLTDAVHGYAPPGSERYNRAASELHWERVHSLFRRNLPHPEP